MKRASILLLAAAVWSACPAQTAEPTSRPPEESDHPPVYRVELLVFRHADGQSDRRRRSDPLDFTDALELELVGRANRLAERALDQLAALLPVYTRAETRAGRDQAGAPRLETDLETIRPLPRMYTPAEPESAEFASARERIAASPMTRPLAGRAWFQRAEPGRATPPVRIHDGVQVAALEPVREGRPLFFPVLPDDIRMQVAPMAPGLVEWFEPAPPARAVFRLDGTARLRRRQFLHLDLDLAWQEPADEAGPHRSSTPLGPASDVNRNEAGPEAWHVHRLVQSRVVEPGRFEYFDSSLFGVLVRITEFAQIVPGDGGEAGASPETRAETPLEAGEGPGRPGG